MVVSQSCSSGGNDEEPEKESHSDLRGDFEANSGEAPGSQEKEGLDFDGFRGEMPRV